MKKITNLLRLLVFLSLVCVSETMAVQKTSITSGLWSAASTWAGGSVPVNGDTAIIANGTTVTVNTGFTLTGMIRVNSGGTLVCSATIKLGNSDSVIVAGTVDITVNNGLTRAQGNDDPRISIWSGGRFRFGTAGTTDIPLWGINTGSIVEYYGAAQTLNTSIGTYSNLVLSGSGTKTLAVNTTVNGTLSMQGSASLSLGVRTFAYGTAAKLEYNTNAPITTGSEWITPFTGSGGVSITNTGTVTLNADKVFGLSVPLTINSGATLATANFQLTFGGNFVNSGTFTAGSSPIVITGTATQSIAGYTTTGLTTMSKTGGVATYTGNVSGGALTMSGSGGTLNLGAGLTHTFTGTLTRTNGMLDCGASTVNFAGPVSGTGGSWTPGTSTVNFTGAGAQTIPGVSYYDLGLSGAGTKTIDAGTTVTVGRNWAVGAPVTLTTTANATVTGNITGTGAITAGSGTITVGGNWTNNGTFTPSTGTVVYAGSAAQTVGALTYNNLAINKAGGVATLGGTATVNGILTLTNGIIATTSSFSLNLGMGSIISGGGTSSYINGKLQKTFGTAAQTFSFAIGDASNYTPVSVGYANITTGGSLAVFTTSGQHGSISTSGINSSKGVNRFWTLTNTGIVSTGYSATFTFTSGDLIGSPDPSGFVVRLYASAWSPTTIGTRTSASTQATGLTTYGDFAVGIQLLDHYAVESPSPQAAGSVFSTTVTGFDILEQQVADDNSTVVTMSSNGSAQFDSNGDGTFGDATKVLANGTFEINTKDDVAETVTITAGDTNGKTGSSSPVIVHRPTVTISGNAGAANAVLSYTDGTPKTATADGAGAYSFSVAYNWSGTVTPALSGYTFTPANRTYSTIITDQSAQNYTATPFVTVNLKVFLAGPFNSGAMTTALNSSALLPLSSAAAYNAVAYNYSPKTVVSIPNTSIVDWVLVELRTLPAGSSEVSTQAAFLKSDGTVVDTDGAGTLTFTNIASNAYYVVIRHRNHLPVMSAAAIPLNASSARYDFTTALDKSYGSNGMTVLSGGSYGMWPGDIDRNGTVKFTGSLNDDAALISIVGVNTLSSSVNGYLDADINLDGNADYVGVSNDHALIIGSVSLERLTRIIASQVPN